MDIVDTNRLFYRHHFHCLPFNPVNIVKDPEDIANVPRIDIGGAAVGLMQNWEIYFYYLLAGRISCSINCYSFGLKIIIICIIF